MKEKRGSKSESVKSKKNSKAEKPDESDSENSTGKATSKNRRKHPFFFLGFLFFAVLVVAASFFAIRKNISPVEPDKNAAVAATFVADMNNYYYQIGNPASTLPLCGYLDKDGTYHPDGALVWNTHMDHDTANLTYCMLVDGGVLKKGQMCRSIAASVRCETYDE